MIRRCRSAALQAARFLLGANSAVSGHFGRLRVAIKRRRERGDTAEYEQEETSPHTLLHEHSFQAPFFSPLSLSYICMPPKIIVNSSRWYKYEVISLCMKL